MFGRKKKKSFFEKLTGGVPADDFDQQLLDEDLEENVNNQKKDPDLKGLQLASDDTGGELAVDVLQDDEAIYIKAMVAGVKPTDLDIDISRDMVTIRGSREEEHEFEHDNYYHRELYWGSFSRNILLPEEVDIDLSEATEKHGLLTLKLPKLDKNKKTKLQVRVK